MRMSRFSLPPGFRHYLRDAWKISLVLFAVFLLLLGAVIVLTERAAVRPFIYTLF